VLVGRTLVVLCCRTTIFRPIQIGPNHFKGPKDIVQSRVGADRIILSPEVVLMIAAVDPAAAPQFALATHWSRRLGSGRHSQRPRGVWRLWLPHVIAASIAQKAQSQPPRTLRRRQNRAGLESSHQGCLSGAKLGRGCDLVVRVRGIAD
jgi:hypothetical protein